MIRYLYYKLRHFIWNLRTLLGYLRATSQDRVELHSILHEANSLRHFSRYMYVLDTKNTREYFHNSNSYDSEGDDIIWQFWLQGIDAAPDIVKVCLESVRWQLPDHKYIFLSECNIENYLCLPGYIYDKKRCGQITNVNFSDILRACLLSKYGGTWMDATVFLTDSLPPEFFSLPLFFFSRTPDTLLGYGHILGSSWYLHAQKKHILIESVRDMLLEFWKHESHCRHHYYFHLILSLIVQQSEYCRRCWEEMPFYSNVPPHVLQFELFKTFNAQRYEIIKAMSPIHKLTYYGSSEFVPYRTGTFYEHIIKSCRQTNAF